MLTLQRRHSQKCPDREKGPNYLHCRRRCPLRICGMIDGKRIRKSLKTRDVRRAARRLADLEEASLSRPRKTIGDAIEAFHDQHVALAAETNRKYLRVTGYLREYCEQESIRYVSEVSVEKMDGYARWRNKTNWTWIKELENFRSWYGRDRRKLSWGDGSKPGLLFWSLGGFPC